MDDGAQSVRVDQRNHAQAVFDLGLPPINQTVYATSVGVNFRLVLQTKKKVARERWFVSLGQITFSELGLITYLFCIIVIY